MYLLGERKREKNNIIVYSFKFILKKGLEIKVLP